MQSKKYIASLEIIVSAIKTLYAETVDRYSDSSLYPLKHSPKYNSKGQAAATYKGIVRKLSISYNSSYEYVKVQTSQAYKRTLQK